MLTIGLYPPNVSKNEYDDWKPIIVAKKVVFMGWGEDDNLGKTFINNIQKGDIVLIAQGANWQKRLLLCGVVSSDAIKGHVEGAPKETYYRKLSTTISKEALDSLGLDFTGAAFGDSNQIPAIYKLKPRENLQDKKIAEILSDSIKKNRNMNELNKVIDILKYKKQIILQGPPGTGKTRLANIVASSLTQPVTITEHDIRDNVIINEEFPSSTNYSKYKVSAISENSLVIESNKAEKSYNINFSEIIKRYNEKFWEKSEIKGGSDAFVAGISKYLSEKLKSKYCKLIQFHPAYSYEDFVRGITAKTNGTTIEYMPENKILGDFANKALKNFNNSQKQPEELSKDIWINDKFLQFKNFIEVEMSSTGKVQLTPNVYISGVDSDHFNYKGDGWANESRINFKDFLSLVNLNILSPLEIDIPRNISQHGWDRKTYYTALIKLFFEKSGHYSEKAVVREPQQNYVLIIDEINRANLPSVLGELIYALEYRGESVESLYELPNEGREIILPPNLYIIGTMNTADRSVGHIDYAIRRRFAFIDVLPSLTPVKEHAKKLFQSVSSLFIKNFDDIDWENPILQRSDYLASDFRPEDVWLGHSYFITNDNDGEEQLKIKLDYEIRPLLKEYIKDGVLNESANTIIVELNVNA